MDRAASHVTKNISSNITFKLVKYFSLWSDITRACIPENEHEEHAYALSLPSMVELGSYDPRVLELMSLGINRSIALKLRKDLPKNVENIEEWLKNIIPLVCHLSFAGILSAQDLQNKTINNPLTFT